MIGCGPIKISIFAYNFSGDVKYYEHVDYDDAISCISDCTVEESLRSHRLTGAHTTNAEDHTVFGKVAIDE